MGPQQQVLHAPQEGTGQPVLVTTGVGEEPEKGVVSQGLVPQDATHSLP